MSEANSNLPPARLTFRRDGSPTFNLFVSRTAFQPTVEEIRAAVSDRNPPLTGEWVVGFWGDRDGFVTIDFDWQPQPEHPSGLSGEHDVVLDAIQEACL